MTSWFFECERYEPRRMAWWELEGCDTCVKWVGPSPFDADGIEVYPGAVKTVQTIRDKGRWTGDCPGLQPKGDEHVKQCSIE
jgi:hypothetical protein